MNGKQLRLLRALTRGPLYEGAAALVLGVTDARMRVIANEARRAGYLTRDRDLSLTITEAGRELVAALTP